jgi:hypothetical protein
VTSCTAKILRLLVLCQSNQPLSPDFPTIKRNLDCASLGGAGRQPGYRVGWGGDGRGMRVPWTRPAAMPRAAANTAAAAAEAG